MATLVQTGAAASDRIAAISGLAAAADGLPAMAEGTGVTGRAGLVVAT